jgi:hypothetical protein
MSLPARELSGISRCTLRAAKFRVGKSECVIVLAALSEPCSFRFPGDIFVQKGREAVGHGHRNKEGPRCPASHGA